MVRGVYHSTSGMNYLQYKQEVTANNIANANTTGFKKDSIFWKTLQRVNSIFEMNSTEQRNLDEVQENYTDFSQGRFNITNNPLDFALDGPGFFSVETPQGIQYTRNGNLSLNQEGLLVTNTGNPVMGEAGTINANGGEVFIEDNGNVVVDGAVLDRLALVEFQDLRQLTKTGEGLFSSGNVEPVAGSPGTVVRQGTLEDSNINIIEEMVKMMATTRFFETGQKSISMQDETLNQAVNEVGRVNR